MTWKGIEYPRYRQVVTIPRSLAPSPEEREQIEKRVVELRRALGTCDIDMSMVHVAKVTRTLASGEVSREIAEARGEAWVDVLSDIPTFAVAEACRRWLRAETGRIGEGKDAYTPRVQYVPLPSEIAQIARPVAVLAKAQADRLERLLDATVVDDEKQPSKCIEPPRLTMRQMEPAAVDPGPMTPERRQALLADLAARKGRNEQRSDERNEARAP